VRPPRSSAGLALAPSVGAPPRRRDRAINLDSFRRNVWTPAVRAAGLDHRTPYALRHTYATWSIAAGIGLYDLARLMCTSVEQGKHYGHLLPDTLDRARSALDAFAAAREEAAESFGPCLGHAREATIHPGSTKGPH